MYLLAYCPPIIPALMLFPVLIAIHIDKKKIDHPIASNIILSAIGFLAGSLIYLVYLGIFYLPFFKSWDDVTQNGWNPTRMPGIILPVLFAGVFLYFKVLRQIKIINFTRSGMVASAFYFLLTGIPFLLPWFLFLSDLRSSLLAFVFPVLFGLWLLLSMSNYTWKYFLTYAVLAVGMVVFYIGVIFLFSAQ